MVSKVNKFNKMSNVSKNTDLFHLTGRAAMPRNVRLSLSVDNMKIIFTISCGTITHNGFS